MSDRWREHSAGEGAWINQSSRYKRTWTPERATSRATQRINFVNTRGAIEAERQNREPGNLVAWMDGQELPEPPCDQDMPVGFLRSRVANHACGCRATRTCNRESIRNRYGTYTG